MAITYHASEDLRVILDGKFVGTIYKLTDDDGVYWQYWPERRQNPIGERFRSLEECKQSLEGG